MKTLKVQCTLTEEALGLCPGTQEVWKNFLEFKKAKLTAKQKSAVGQKDEMDTIDMMSKELENNEKGITVFPKLDGVPFFFDYQIKGFFKDVFKALLSTNEGIWEKDKAKNAVKLSNFTATRIVDQLVFPSPRKIFIKLPEGAEMGVCERSLRAETLQGPRTTLACSETVPEGSVIEFEVKFLNEKLENYIKEALDYGALRGFGQWRNSGKGRFTWEEI